MLLSGVRAKVANACVQRIVPIAQWITYCTTRCPCGILKELMKPLYIASGETPGNCAHGHRVEYYRN
jgi:hypothetical protein